MVYMYMHRSARSARGEAQKPPPDTPLLLADDPLRSGLVEPVAGEELAPRAVLVEERRLRHQQLTQQPLHLRARRLAVDFCVRVVSALPKPQ